MSGKGMSKLNIKKTNQMQILMLLKSNGAMSRVDLARELSLTKAGVSTLVSEMLEEGTLAETGECLTDEAGKPGKKKIAININPACGCTIGCIVDLDFIYTGTADVRGCVLREYDPVPMRCTTPEQLLEVLLQKIGEVVRCEYCEKLLGIGIGINADVLTLLHRGRGLYQEVQQRIAAATGLRVTVDSSTRALAIAQIDYGKTEQNESILFVQENDTINMAFVLGGEIYTGAHKNAGNMGHVVVDPNGPMCTCGRRGCAKALVSVKYVLQHIKKIYSKETFPILYELTNGNPEQLNYDAVVLAAYKGDLVAKKIYDKAENLSLQLLLNLVNMFDPEKCYIHGIGVYADEYIAECNKMAEQTLDKRYRNVFELSFLNAGQSFLGGCAIAGRRYFYQKADYEQDFVRKF